jgi:hypothetical protein
MCRYLIFSLQTGRLTVGRIGRRYLGAKNVLTFRGVDVDNGYGMTRSLEVDKTATMHILATVPCRFSFVSLPPTLQNPFPTPSPQRDVLSPHIFLHKSTVHSPGTPGVSKDRVENAR